MTPKPFDRWHSREWEQALALALVLVLVMAQMLVLVLVEWRQSSAAVGWELMWRTARVRTVQVQGWHLMVRLATQCETCVAMVVSQLQWVTGHRQQPATFSMLTPQPARLVTLLHPQVWLQPHPSSRMSRT